jgi:hypothetical protein
MSGTTFSGTITVGVTLAPSDNPAYVMQGAFITGPDGIYGAAATNWTIDNHGTLIGTDATGIYFGQGGTVTNEAVGTIAGVATGVLITGDRGTIRNAGTIAEAAVGGAAISLANGGLVDNNAATASIDAGSTGVYITGQSGTVLNQGSIIGALFPIYLKSVGVVSNAATGLIEGAYGIKGYSANTAITNLGTIKATATLGSGFGVYLRHGGAVVNGSSGSGSALIQSYYGVTFRSDTPGSQYASSVTNFGTVLATGADGVANDLDNGGTVVNGASNATGAFLEGGRWGVHGGLVTTITNFGTIASTGSIGTDAGVYVQTQAGIVSNLGPAALIEGNYGVDLAASGTLINAGTIASTQSASGVAVQLGAGGLLVVKPGAVFIGTVASNASTMELAGTAASTLSGLGSYFTGFDTITVDPGAAWTITGYNVVAGGATISVGTKADLAVTGSLVGGAGFVLTHATLDLANAVDPGASFTLAGTADLLSFGSAGGYSFDNPITGFNSQDQITLPNLAFAADSTPVVNGTSLTVDLQAGGSFTFSDFNFQPGSPQTVDVGTDFIKAPTCFVAGTRVSTERGQVRVEAIRLHDRIHVLVGNGSQPVIWIGRRAIDCARHPQPQLVWPVRITPGAFGIARPSRDLWLSPNHAIFVDGVLIPVKFLINGTSIAQVAVPNVIYYHLELPSHDVLLAEGLPAESYLDVGDRADLGDHGTITLHPNFAERWDAGGCAPLIVTGPALAAAKRQINPVHLSRKRERSARSAG